VQLVPLYELGQVNFRQESATFQEVMDYGFPARRVVTLALPNFFGNPTHHSYTDVFSGEEMTPEPKLLRRGQNQHRMGHQKLRRRGDLPGHLAALFGDDWRAGSWRKRKTHVGFFAVLSFFSLAFIFGTPLYAILYYGLPFVNQLHTPFRWVFPLSLAVAVLAGFWRGKFGKLENWGL
jgi:hypothetical protein